MKQVAWCLAVAALLAIALGCSSFKAPGQVGVTKEASLVAGCENLGEVSVSPGTRSEDVLFDLAQKARSKGGNYVLIASDGAREGSAYRCEVPSSTGARGSGSK